MYQQMGTASLAGFIRKMGLMLDPNSDPPMKLKELAGINSIYCDDGNEAQLYFEFLELLVTS